ncbi:MAG: PASTA domain-containing protein [Oscillospiraceae bacterium]|nr:PASTA domain-containing protein [Oscillospiraceae bacterium]
MTDIFYDLLNMSLKASYVILAVILVRFLLKKAPKKYSYALWAAAAFRLVCPVSFKSVISLFALQAARNNTTYVDLTQVVSPAVNTIQPRANVGIPVVDTAINNSLPAPTPQYSANPMQIIMYIAMMVWLAGIAVLLLYGVISYIRLHRKLRFAVKFEDNIWQSEVVSSPFIMGFVKPRIYIPYGLDTDKLSYVLAHEKEHIRRLDHIIKPLAFIILTVHWFNPLVWLSFYLMSRDMEMSCDEKVLSKNDVSSADYSTTLLSLAVKKRFPSPSPLAFGESGVKGRIKNALKFKKPAVWITVVAVIICIAVIFICAADPKEKAEERDMFGTVYSTNGLAYVDGMFSYVPEEKTAGKYYVDDNGTMYERGWTAEEGWNEMGTFEKFGLTKSNFDELFRGVEMWSGGCSADKIRKSNVNAWEFTNGGNFYYLLEQDDGEVYLAIGHNDKDFEEPLIRWLFVLEATGKGEFPEYALSGDSYVSYQCLYMTPVSSFAAVGGDSGYRYLFVMDEELAYCKSFVRIDRSTGNMMSFDYSDWGVFPYTEEEWNDMFTLYPVDISGYTAREWMQLNGSCALAMMDSSELWFIQLGKHPDGEEYIWSIYSLVPEEYMGKAEWDYSEGETLKIDFDIPGNMTAVCTQSDISADGVNFDVGAEWSNGGIRWTPVNESGEPVYNAQIHYSSDTGYAGTIYIVGSFSGDGMHYSVETSGTGLYIENVDEGVRISVKDEILAFEEDIVTVPDMLGYSIKDAAYELQSRNLKYEFEYVDSEMPLDWVVSQSHEEGTKVPERTVVVLEVSNGELMPDNVKY